MINAFCPLDESKPIIHLIEAGDLPDSSNMIKLYFIEQDASAPFDSLFVCD